MPQSMVLLEAPSANRHYYSLEMTGPRDKFLPFSEGTQAIAPKA